MSRYTSVVSTSVMVQSADARAPKERRANSGCARKLVIRPDLCTDFAEFLVQSVRAPKERRANSQSSESIIRAEVKIAQKLRKENSHLSAKRYILVVL